MADFDLEAVETAVLASPVKERADLTPAMLGHIAPAPESQTPPQAAPEAETGTTALPGPEDAASVPEGTPHPGYKTFEEWHAGFQVMHHVGGAFLGAEKLGDHAQSGMGLEASKASYELADMNDTTREWFLSRGSGVIGNVITVSTYLFMTWQIIREARAAKLAENVDEPQFTTTRQEAA